MVCEIHCLCDFSLLTIFRNFIFNEKYDAKDPGVYELLESPQGNHSSHDLFHGGHEFFEGVQRSFSRHAHSWFGGDEEEEEDTSRSVRPRPIDGAQIQLTRRYVNPNQISTEILSREPVLTYR